MAYDNHGNFGYDTVATAPSPATSGTSLVLTANNLVASVPFNATVWPPGVAPLASNAEIVRVTANSSGTLTITRAQEGTSAKSIATNWQIANTITAKMLTDIENAKLEKSGDTMTGNLTLADAINIIVNSTTGTQIATASTQKLGFWGHTPAVQPAAWTITGVTPNRTFAASGATVAQVAQAFGTWVQDQQGIGMAG